eukprot:9475396-Alexandrium_andersonii.AAC.1
MSASLVGSEMCIRDRYPSRAAARAKPKAPASLSVHRSAPSPHPSAPSPRCLLYTSDAADDM